MLNRRTLGRLGIGIVLGAAVGCSPDAKEPLIADPGMKTAVIKAEGMH